jgi:hypothetical protein
MGRWWHPHRTRLQRFSRWLAAGGIRSEDAVHRNNRAPRRERHDRGGSRVGRRSDRASAAWYLESCLTATDWIGYDPRSSFRSLKEATEEVTEILGRFNGLRDEDYDTTIEEIDERLFSAIRQFFKVLHDDGAKVRIVEGQQDKQFGWDAVERAHRRVEETRIEEAEIPIEEVLIGVIPIARRFELRLAEGGQVISGKVGPLLTRDYLGRIENHEETVGKQWLAIIRKRTVHRPGRKPTTTNMLPDLREPGGHADAGMVGA